MTAQTRSVSDAVHLSASADAALRFAAPPVRSPSRVDVNGTVGQPSGRFGTEFELDGIFRGMRDDLQRRVGMLVRWAVWDAESTGVDDVYSVGSLGVGRRWRPPIDVPVIVAQVFQGQTVQNERGFYNADVLRLTVSMDDITRALPDLVDHPDAHIRDRVLYRGAVFSPTRLYLRGQVLTSYTVLTIDLNQVMPEEMVNDDQFEAFSS